MPILFVDGGVHRGAAMPVPVGGIAIGGDADCGIVISDLPVPTAFKLNCDGRSIHLSAIGCDMTVNGKAVAQGKARKLKRSSRLACGNIAFRLELPPAAMAPPRRARWLVAVGGGLAATVASVAAPAWAPPMRFSVSREAPVAVPAVAVRGSDAAVPTPRPAHDNQALLGELRHHIVSAGLDGISVDLQPDGALAASGHIVPAKGDAWRAALRWFDTAALGQAVLVDHVKISASPAAEALQVQAVYMGRTPYVIDEDGQKFFVGATLADGGVIQAIENKRVLVKHGDRLTAVLF